MSYELFVRVFIYGLAWFVVVVAIASICHIIRERK